MSKKNRNTVISFRCSSEHEKNQIKKELENFGYNEIDAIRYFLKHQENNEFREASALIKREDAINKRNKLLVEINNLNLLIEALNKQLKDVNPKRYDDLTEHRHTIEVYDDKGEKIDLNKIGDDIIL